MLGWSKKLEGFNIRAAIQLRHEQLGQRILDARRAAGPQIHAVGAAMVAGLRAAGAGVSGGARAGLGLVSVGAQRLAAMRVVVWQKLGIALGSARQKLRTAATWGALGTAAGPIWQKGRAIAGKVSGTLGAALGSAWQKLRTAATWGTLGAAAGPIWQKLRAIARNVSGTLGTALESAWQKLRTTTIWGTLGAAAGPIWQKLHATGRKVSGTLDAAVRPVWQKLRATTARPDVTCTLAAGGAMALGVAIGRCWGASFDREVVVMLAIAGMLIASLLPMALHRLAVRFPRPAGLSPRVALVAVAVAVFAAGAVWFANPARSVFAGFGGSMEVVGRASALSGGLLRVAGTTMRLAGIEEPEREQRCGKVGNRWRCAEGAQSALSKVVSERPAVRCRLSGSDKAGHPLGYCWIDPVDINAELVRLGYVFAEVGMFARYTAQEKEARNGKAGMWIGDTQRPAEFLAKAWEEAKSRAPDGCPIKGQVTSGERVYVLPGTRDYEHVRVLTSRGDRWFCSEQEAASAGFKAGQSG